MAFKMDAGSIITALLVLLCSLASLDLWRQYAINSDDYWFLQYTLAVRSDDNFWKMGFRIEDLEQKLESQKQRWLAVTHAINTLAPRFTITPHSLRPSLPDDISLTRRSRVAVHNLLNNETSVGQIRCGEEGPLLRVGLNDFRTDPRDSCGLFVSTGTEDNIGPHAMFEMVPQDEDAFSLKFLGNGMYLQAVPPSPDSPSLPWKIIVGGPIPGAAERFRYTDEGYLYSHLMGGFFTCHSGEMVTGYQYEIMKSSSYVKFKFQSVSDSNVHRALEIVHLSDQIKAIQRKDTDSHRSSDTVRKAASSLIVGSENPNSIRICMGIPMTSKGTKMNTVTESPLWTNLFDSFMKSIDWRSNRFIFKFYIGLDKADNLYDTGDAWSEIREEFTRRAIFRMKEQQVDNDTVEKVMAEHLSLKILHFDHLEGAPTQVVSQLVLAAYADNFDYFYQVNDDTIIETPNWATKFVETLASNPSIPNFGVTGPTDSNNDKIFTHSFTHRTHIEVFGHLFPPSFKNWWSDDWISTVYGAEHTFLLPDIVIKHNVGAQKEHGYTRYEVDKGAQARLENELIMGHVKLDEWLKKSSLPRLPLPSICGYIPLARHLNRALKVPEPEKPHPIQAPADGDRSLTKEEGGLMDYYSSGKEGKGGGGRGDREEKEGREEKIEVKKVWHPAPISEESLKKGLGWT